MLNSVHAWPWEREKRATELVTMVVKFASIHVGTRVQQAHWPTAMKVQIGEKMSFQCSMGEIPLKNRRTIQVLNATLGVHGRTADGLGETTG